MPEAMGLPELGTELGMMRAEASTPLGGMIGGAGVDAPVGRAVPASLLGRIAAGPGAGGAIGGGIAEGKG
jgi:hypothetical protein